jgi:Methyltransferase domain
MIYSSSIFLIIKKNNMIKVKTEYPIAADSDDHKYPEGVYYDNNITYKFVEEIENYFGNKQINLLDLGCAGGELVCRMVDRGHSKSVGLEGSDHCLNLKPEMVDEIGFLPLGYTNWRDYAHKNLFTCDITKEYQILDDDKPMEFDLITSWDVMEHFEPDSVDTFLQQIYNHIKPNGLFISQIALFHSGRHSNSKNTPNDLDYHKSVFPRDWWLEKINKYYNQIDYPFSVGNRDQTYGSSLQNPSYLIYAGIKK